MQGDHYEVLGIARNASAEQIKAAYRALAKAFHPDSNLGGDPSRFSRVTEAYETLGNPERRLKYDEGLYEAPASEERPKRLEPICCSQCGKVTAQPRYAVFWTVISIVVVTWRTPSQGIFCSSCARKVALRCSAISAFAGWWGVWGLIWTPIKILANAGGGDQAPGSAMRLLWYNALAFWSQGKLATAHALAKMVAKSNTDMAIDAAKMVADLQRAGVPADSPGFADAWRSTFSDKLLHVGLLAAVPLIVAVLVAQDGATSTGRDFSSPASTADGIPSTFSSSDPRPSVPTPVAPPPPAPTCDHEIANGAILGGGLADTDFGHRIEIKNGSSGPAIIRVRDAQSGHLQVAFYVGKDGQADVGPLPDGTYRIQYAIGEALAASCKSLIHPSASEFPDTESFATQEFDGRRMAQRLSYTLYSVPSGNVRPTEIDLATFEAD